MSAVAVRSAARSGSPSSLDSVAAAIEAAGDAWSWLVLREATVCGITRFDSFHQHLGIARSTLAARLESLCSAGLLVKANRAAAAKPEYRLTSSGEAFTPCLLMAMNWADRWLPAPEGPPLLVEHVTCGSTAGIRVHCAVCMWEAQAREVEFSEVPPFPMGQARVRMPDLELLERNGPCSIARTLKVTGDRWSSLVLRGAFFGLRRFDQFEQSLGIAPNILSQRLTRLVELGVLRRAQYAERPLRHEYRLSTKGLDLYPMYLAMLAWGSRWTDVGPDDPRLRHIPCGQSLNPVVCCAACRAEVHRSDLVLWRRTPHARV